MTDNYYFWFEKSSQMIWEKEQGKGPNFYFILPTQWEGA